MLVSADVYRPAAFEQLKRLASDLDVAFFPSSADEKPLDIVKKALDSAKKQFIDVLIIDTAGRLHIDTDMMSEIKALHKATTPAETLFVVDSMTGQDAANTAKAFHEALPLTGIILTKTDTAEDTKIITKKVKDFEKLGEKVFVLSLYDDKSVKKLRDELVKIFKKKS